MDELSATAVRLLACTIPGALHSALVVTSPRAVITSLLADAAAPEREAVAEALSAIASGELDLIAGLQRATAALETIDASPDLRAVLRSRLEAANQSLALVQGLSALLGSQALQHTELSLGDPALLSFITTLSLQPRAAGPEVVIVGANPERGERVGVRFGRRTPLDRVELGYDSTSPYPLLTLTTASRGEEVDWAPTRMGWRQEPGPEFDLMIQNSTGARNLGTVRTEILEPPWSYEGARLSVSIPAIPGRTLVCTSIADQAGRVLAHSLRISRSV